MDLTAAVSSVWQFSIESGAVPAVKNIRVEDAVDVRFLP
jgi:hypothetical protein